jgi:hypothetical protein
VTKLLNAAQRNSLTIGLRSFEADLRRADAWLQDEEERGILYRRSLDLPPEGRAVARAQIAAALARIATLAERFDLVVTEDDLGATIAAQMSVDWANLCDIRSDKLLRYGEVDPRLVELLDSAVSALEQLAFSLAALSRGDPAQ